MGPSMLSRLCRALAAFGEFTVDADTNVGHTQKSRWLRTDATPTLPVPPRFNPSPSTSTSDDVDGHISSVSTPGRIGAGSGQSGSG